MPGPGAGGPGLPGGSAPLLLHVFPTFAVGGAQVRFAALANLWGGRFRHAVVALDGRTDCLERLSPGAPVAVLPSPVTAGQGPGRFLAIRRFLSDLAPALLVTSNWGAIEWAAANLLPPRLPHLHTEDGFGPDEAHGQMPRRVWFRRLVLRGSTLALPSLTLRRIAEESWRLPPARLHYIANGLDLSRFAAAGPLPALAIPGEGPVIGTVARLRAEKNLGRLIEACARLRERGLAFRLLIVGDGPEEDSLRRRARALGLADRTLFAGHHPDPAPLYRAMDVLALSSDTEQMPFSVLEAMASSLPVASTEVGDVRAMVAAANAPFVAGRDAASLAGSLARLLEDEPLRRSLGAANRAKAEAEYDERVMAERYAALAWRLISGGRS
ncbi:MAG: glycosyltransferase [Acetobacteraceae bacterium]